MKPLRKVVGVERWQTRYHGPRSFTVTLKLECGHEVHRKGHAEPKARARCNYCPDSQ